jgi:hypothetical protein
MDAALLQPIAEDESYFIKVRFNDESYGSWQVARDAFNQLKNKKGGSSVWSKFKLTLVPDDKDDNESPFKLRCFSCGNSCQLDNPFNLEQGTCLQGTAEQHTGHLQSTTPKQPDNTSHWEKCSGHIRVYLGHTGYKRRVILIIIIIICSIPWVYFIVPG